MGNSNNNQRHQYRCCAHNNTSAVDYQCAGYTPYLSPCCMHPLNTIGPKCSFIRWYRLVLIYNIIQLILLISQIIYALMPDTIMTIIALFCVFTYSLGKMPQRNAPGYNTYIGLAGLAILYFSTKVLVFLTPSFLSSFWSLLVGVVALIQLLIIIRDKDKLRNNKQYEQNRFIREQKCCICLDKNSSFCVYPCLHASYCENCVGRINQCALCRSPITDRRSIGVS